MATLTNDCEGTNGTTLTTANSDDSGGTALANVTGTWTYSTTGKAHGNTGWRCVSSGTAWRAYFSYSGIGTVAVRIYFTLNSLPNAARDILSLINAAFGSNMRVGLDATNHLQVKNAAGSVLFTATAALSAATSYRVEYEVNVGTTTTNGSISFRYYVGDSSTAVQSYSASNVNAGAGSTIIRTQLGNNDAVSIDITFDDIVTVTGSTTPIGPYSTAVNVPMPIGNMTMDALSPTVAYETRVAASPPTVNFAALAPTVTADVTVMVPTAQIIIAAPVPSASAVSNVTVDVPSASMSINALAPSITVGGSILVAVPSAIINLEAPNPTIVGGGSPGRPGQTMQDARYASFGGPVSGKTFRDLFVEKVPNVLLAWGQPGDTYVEAERRKYGAQNDETIQDARSRYYHNNDV